MSAEMPHRLVTITTTGGTEIKISGHTQAGYTEIINDWEDIVGTVLDPFTFNTTPATASFLVLNNVPIGGYSRFSKIPGIIFGTIVITHNGVEIFNGTIDDTPEVSNDYCKVNCVGMESELIKDFDYEIVTEDTFSNADPSDLGKMLPQVWGQAKRVPFLGIDVGATSVLFADIDDLQTTGIELSALLLFDTSSTCYIKIDNEIISFTAKSGNVLAGTVTRGDGGTTATTHSSGAIVSEMRSEYVYAIGNAVKSINNVYMGSSRMDDSVVDFDVYTGQSGDEHSTYTGRACVVLNSPLIDSMPGSMPYLVGVNQMTVGMSFPTNQPLSIDSDTSTFWDTLTDSFTSQAIDAVDKKTLIYAYTNPYPDSRIITRVAVRVLMETYGTSADSACVVRGGPVDDMSRISNAEIIADNYTPNSFDPTTKGWFEFVLGSAPQSWVFMVGCNEVANSNMKVYEVICEAEFDKINTVNFVGTSWAGPGVEGPAEMKYRTSIFADVNGYQDSEDDLIELPTGISQHIIETKCGKTGASDSTSYSVVEAMHITDSYTEAFALVQKPNIRELLADIALQSKCIQFFWLATHYMKYMGGTYAVDAVITADDIYQKQAKFFKTNKAYIINSIVSKYNKYWWSTEANFNNTVSAEDTDSQDIYGLKLKSLDLPYIPDSAQTQDVTDWQLLTFSYPLVIVEYVGNLRHNIHRRIGQIITFDTTNDYLYELFADEIESTDKFLILSVTFTNDGKIKIMAITAPEE